MLTLARSITPVLAVLAAAGCGGASDEEIALAATLDAEAPSCSRMVAVSDAQALAQAAAAVHPGDCIIAADGGYRGASIDIAGTAAAPVVLRAAHRGKATFTTHLKLHGSYITLDGFVFSAAANVAIEDCDHCRVTRSRFHLGGGQWISVSGNSDATRIDHNELGPRNQDGNMVAPTGLSTHTLIDHNYFHDVAPSTGNGRETIRLGCCGPTYDYHDTGNIVELNLLVACSGEAEIVSVKSSSNTIRYNTIHNSAGTITLRAGKRNSVYGNFVFGDGKDGGLRVYEDDHRIFDNYVETAAALQANGNGNGHAPMKNAIIVHNTFIGTVRWAHDSGTDFSDNVVGGAVSGALAPGGHYAANFVTGAAPGGGGFVRRDPKLARAGELLALTAGSPAIDAAVGRYAFVSDDVDGQPRDAKPDVGADEWSAAPAARRPLTIADVGPAAP